MTESKKTTFKSILVFFGCTAIFVLSSYLYLNYKMPTTDSKTGTNESSVPYEKNECENKCLLFQFDDNSAVMFYLDFTHKCTTCAIFEDYSSDDEKSMGYSADFTLKTPIDTVGGIIDRIGGIELDMGQGKYRYTGIQITDMISSGVTTQNFCKDIVNAVCKKISAVGISNDDLVYIIEHTDTTLTFPDCYLWSDNIKELFMRLSMTS